MVKKILIAAALVIASPALVFSQDIFWSFDSASNVTTTTGDIGTSGTAYIFSDQPFAYDAIDLNFTTSDSSVLLLTGGTALNGEYAGNPFISGPTFNSTMLELDTDPTVATGESGNLFAVNITENGIIPAAASFNDQFAVGAGSGSGAFRLAEVTYDIVGTGTATLEFSLGLQGVLGLPAIVIDPSFGTATLTVEPIAVPEPSSLALLVFGSAGLVVRRKRSKVVWTQILDF